MKRYRGALILAIVLVVVLGGIATWDEWKTKKDDVAKETANKPFSFTPDSVTEIRFTNKPSLADMAANKKDESAGEPFSTTLTKMSGKWQMSTPVATEADESSVTSLLNTLKDYKWETNVGSDRSRWKEFGLDPVRRTVELTYTADGQSHKATLFVGNKAPVGYSVYFATDSSNNVYMGSQYLATSTNKSLMDFRDKAFLKLDEPGVKEFSYKTKATQAIFAHANGKYTMTAPEAFATDSDAVELLISDMIRAKTTEFNDKPTSTQLQAFAPKNQLAELKWTSTQGVTTMLVVAEIDKRAWATTDLKRLVLVPDDLKAKLLDKKLSDFRDRKIFNFSSRDVDEIKINGESYVKAKDLWFTPADAEKAKASNAAPKDLPESKAFVQSLLIDIEGAKTDSFEDPKALAKKLPPAPRDRLELKMSEASKKGTMQIDVWANPEDKDRVYVKRTGSEYIFKAPASIFANTKDQIKVGSLSQGTPDPSKNDVPK